MLQIDNITIPLRELKFTYVRSSGPGGQNVNKLSTKAILVWSLDHSNCIDADVKKRIYQKFGNKINKVGEIVLSSDRFRDQGRNTADCLEKLSAIVRSCLVAPKPRKKSKPNRSQKEQRLREKKAQSDKKSRRKSITFI